jgi:uncharacterized membrane protein (DUF485 family)
VAKAKQERQKRRGVDQSPEVIEAHVRAQQLKWSAVVVLAFFGGLSLLAYAATPLATAIAGTNTNFNFNISLVFNLTLLVSTAVGGAATLLMNKARRQHKKRVRELEQRIREIQNKPDI